jgi:branched-chain amino acid transport system substrate-binding protein
MGWARSLLKAALAALAFLTLNPPARAEDSVKIGITFDAAKQASFYSVQQKQALEMLAADVNASGGVLGRPLELRFLDDENNPTIAAQRVEQLNNDQVAYIIEVGSSATGLLAQQKAQELGIPNGSPANQNARLTRPNLPSFYFRTGLLDVTMSEAAAFYIGKHVPDAKVAIVKDPTPQGLMLGDAAEAVLKNAGISVVAVEQVPTGAASATPQALRVMGAGANAVLMVAAALPEMVSYTKAHRQAGNKSPIFGFSATGVSEFITLAGGAADGVIVTDIIDYDRPDVAALTKRLAERDPNLLRSPFGIVAYGYGQLVVDAIKRAGSTDRAKIREAMESTKDFPTVLGYQGTKITFSPSNHDGITRADQIVFRVVKEGRFVTLR